MAEQDNLGDLSVNITGDFSELQQAIDQASQVAQTGAQSIADAINKSGEAADEAAGKFNEMAEALVGIGEALAVTEALKEFGTEALNAFGTVESVTVGLTQLTGSVEEATTAIEGIKELASTEPFAFPDIAPTAQRLVALGVSIEQLPDVMHAAADAAAATGNSFDAVANALGRIEVTGQVSARQLVALGLSWQDLATAAGTSISDVQALLKKGGQDAQADLDLVVDALGKFGGAAVAQATTVKGAWQILQNQFEEVMVGVGAAIEPAIQDLIGFAKAALSAAQGVIDAFNQLPGPLKEAAGWFALITASIAPMAVAVGTLGLGIAGITAALGPLNTLLEGLGVAGGEAAAGEEAAALGAEHLAAAQVAAVAATEGVGASSVIAAGEVGALGVGLGGLVAVLVGPVVAALIATKSNLDDLKAKWDEVIKDILSNSIVAAVGAGETVKDLQNIGYTIDQIKVAFGNFGIAGKTAVDQLDESMKPPIQTLTNLGVEVDDIQSKLKGLAVDGVPVFQLLANSPDFATFRNNIQTLGGNIDQIVSKLNQLSAASPSTVAGFKSMADGLGIVVVSTDAAQKAFDTLADKQDAANQKVKDAKAVLDIAKAALDGTADSAANYNRALVAYDAALQQANPHTKDFATSVQGLSDAFAKTQATATNTIAAFEQIKQAFLDGTASLGLFLEAYNKAESAAKSAGQSFSDSTAQVEKLTKAVSDQVSAITDSVSTWKTLQGLDIPGSQLATAEALKAVSDAASKLGLTVTQTGDSIQFGISDKSKIASDSVKGLLDTLNALYPPIQQAGIIINGTFVPALKAVADTLPDIEDKTIAFNGTIQETGADLASAGGAALDATNQITVLKGSVDDASKSFDDADRIIIGFNGSVSTGASVASSMAAALKDMGDAAAQAAGQIQNLATADDQLTEEATKASGAQGGIGKNGKGGSQTNSGEELASYIGFLSPFSAGLLKNFIGTGPDPLVNSGATADATAAVNLELEQLSGSFGQLYTGTIAATDPLVNFGKVTTAASSAVEASTAATVATTTATAAAGVAMTSLPLQIDPVTGAIINLGNAASGTAANIAYGTSSLSNATSDAADAASQTSTDLANLNTSVGGTINTWNGLVQANQDLVNQFAAGTLSMQQWTADSGAAALQFLNSSSSISTMSTAASGAAQSLSSVTDGMSIYGSQLFQASKDLSDAQARFLSGNQGSQDETIGDAQAVLDSVVAQGHLGGFTGTGTGGPADMTAALKDSGLTQVGQQLYQSQVDLAAALNRASTGNQGTNDLSVSDAQAQVSAVLASMGLGSLTGTGSSASLVGAAALGRTAGDTGINYAAYAPPTYTAGNPLPVTIQNQPPAAITVNLNGVVQNPQQTQQAVQNGIVAGLRQAGLKL